MVFTWRWVDLGNLLFILGGAGSQQDHQFMNACILNNPKVKQTCNGKTMIDQAKMIGMNFRLKHNACTRFNNPY